MQLCDKPRTGSRRIKQLRTDLVSAGVEEVAQADYVAVVQLSHDLQFTVLKEEQDDTEVWDYIGTSHSELKKMSLWTFKKHLEAVLRC